MVLTGRGKEALDETGPSGNHVGGSKMLEFAEKYANLTVPNTKPLDQAYAALYLASDMGAMVTG